MDFVGIEFVQCFSCEREVRVWSAPLAARLSEPPCASELDAVVLETALKAEAKPRLTKI